LLEKVADGSVVGTDVVGAVMIISRVAEEHMGGTSGALYS
jgi:dihydroxyacetone kinase